MEDRRIRTVLHKWVSEAMGDPPDTIRVEYWNPHTQTFYWGMPWTQEELKASGRTKFYPNAQTIKIEYE
jgi:hypothetical protein